MNLSKKEYSEMTGKRCPASPIWKDLFLAFVSGGLICTLGQALCQCYMTYFSLDKKTANTWVSITPITGFSNSITAPAIEFKSEGQVFGIGAKMFIMAGPVIVYGTIASMVYGAIVWIFHLY